MVTSAPGQRPGRQRHKGQGEHAYNLVVLVMAITVLNVLVAMSLPVTSQQIRRDREEELIFRGLQYAEALRVFQVRYNRQPVRLDELAEDLGKGRSIRKLWHNPMVEKGSWALLLVTGQGNNVQAVPNGLESSRDNRGNGQAGESGGAADGAASNGLPVTPIAEVPQRGEEGSFASGRRNDVANIQGPIRGVFSPEGGESIKSFFGSTQITEWQFTPDLLAPPGSAGGTPGTGGSGNGRIGGPQRGNQVQQVQQGGQPPGQQKPPNAGVVGRPFPPGLSPQIGGQPGASGQQQPGSLGSANLPQTQKTEEN